MKLVLIVVLGGAAQTGSSVQAAEFHVDTTTQRTVKFTSKAPLESFDGVTSRIDGYASITSDSLALGAGYDSSQFYFEVDLNALDTGIGLRNRHMRENYLETDRYPYAQYQGRLSGVSAEGDSLLRVSTLGDLTIHGVKRSMVDTLVVRREGARYHIRARFPVALPDYKIKVPKLMFMKISDTVKVSLDFFVYPISQSTEGQ